MQVENVDMIICTMHIAPQTPPELQQIYTAIRSYHPNTPVVMFSGHSHVMYFEQLDENCFTLESGKYFEVIGLVEFDLEAGQFENFAYQWIETSLENFYQLSGTTEDDFLTPSGQRTKDMIEYYTNVLHLNDTLGCSPQFYDPDKVIFEPLSLYNLYIEAVVPTMVFNSSLPNTQFFISNTATLRYPLYNGRVNVNDIYSISPFSDSYLYYPGLTGLQLQELVRTLLVTPASFLAQTPYFHTYAPQNLTRPAYTHSLIKIDPSQTYDVVSAKYDTGTITPLLDYLFPNTTWTPQPYPSKYRSTDALGSYIVEYMPCSASCSC